MINRKEIKAKAKEFLKENLWTILGNIIVITILFSIFSAISGMILGFIGGIIGLPLQTSEIVEFFGQPIEVTNKTLYGNIVEFVGSVIGTVGSFGVVYFVLNYLRGIKKEIADVLNYVRNNLKNIIIVSILYSIFITLGSMLFVIPGMIVALGLAFVPEVLNDNPELQGMDVIKKSWELTKGHKMDLFVFGLSFIGWSLLCIFIIPVIYVMPYIMVSQVLFYEKLRSIK